MTGMVRPVHVCCGVVFLATPVHRIDWRTSLEEAVRQCLAPPFHLAASQSRPEPARLCKATGRQLPPTSSTCCSFVSPHRPPGAVSVADLSAALTWSMGEMLCPMVTGLGQLSPRPVHQ